ncbi:unnamed protein product, partial [Ectocarpus fasciculatus]
TVCGVCTHRGERSFSARRGRYWTRETGNRESGAYHILSVRVSCRLPQGLRCCSSAIVGLWRHSGFVHLAGLGVILSDFVACLCFCDDMVEVGAEGCKYSSTPNRPHLQRGLVDER